MGTRRNEAHSPSRGWDTAPECDDLFGGEGGFTPFPGIDTILKSSRTKRTRQSDQHEPALPWPRSTEPTSKISYLPHWKSSRGAGQTGGPAPSSIGQLYYVPAINHWRQSLASWGLDG